MRALLLAPLPAFAALPANAGYIYELTGHIDYMGDAQSVPDVLHVGDTFVATAYYGTGPGANTGSAFCSDEGFFGASFDFGDIQINGRGGGVCMNEGYGMFFNALYGTEELTRWGNNGSSPWGYAFGEQLLPDDLSDQFWLNWVVELRLFGPPGLESPVVQYYVSFDEVLSRKVPEPSALALLAIGVVGGALARRRSRDVGTLA